MALCQLRERTGQEEPLVTEILRLTERCLAPADHRRMAGIFFDTSKNIQYILSRSYELIYILMMIILKIIIIIIIIIIILC